MPDAPHARPSNGRRHALDLLAWPALSLAVIFILIRAMPVESRTLPPPPPSWARIYHAPNVPAPYSGKPLELRMATALGPRGVLGDLASTRAPRQGEARERTEKGVQK